MPAPNNAQATLLLLREFAILDPADKRAVKPADKAEEGAEDDEEADSGKPVMATHLPAGLGDPGPGGGIGRSVSGPPHTRRPTRGSPLGWPSWRTVGRRL